MGVPETLTSKVMLFLVEMIQRELKDDPNVNPAIGLFRLVQLRTIDGYHEESVVRCDGAIKSSLQVSATTEDVIIRIDKTIIHEKRVEYLLCLVPVIMHLFCAFRMSPEGLELGANGNSVKHCARVFVSSNLLKLVEAWLTTFGAGIEICMRTDKSNAQVDAHMTDDRCDTSEIAKKSFDLIERGKFGAWKTSLDAHAYLLICIFR